MIGDGTAAGRNVISGNEGEGIALWTNSPNTEIRGNYIGVGADGVTPLGNALLGGVRRVLLRRRRHPQLHLEQHGRWQPAR